ncbi:fimbrial protein [Pseudomonas monteilii]|nr:fimbrial protein [Pseudomonas monteilii]
MSSKQTSSPTTLAGVLCLVFLALFSGHSLASCQWVQGNTSSTLNMSATLIASSEAPILSPLSDWIEESFYPLWKCNSGLNLNPVGVFTKTNASASGELFENLTVYKTATPGVGFVAKRKTVTDRGDSSWSNINNVSWGKWVDSPATLGVALAVRLIKIGPILPGTQLNRTEVAVAYSSVQSISGASNPDLFTYISIPPINFIVPTCTVNDTNVRLDDVYIGQFNGTGSEIGNKDFNLVLHNCPGGFSKITYQLDPVNEIIDVNKGLLQIDQGTGSATGVAIRIKGKEDPLVFGTTQTLKNYMGNKGTYNIPLSASYYQTGAITPGATNALLELTIGYQ